MWPRSVLARLYSGSRSSRVTARQDLGHFRNLGKPRPPTPGSLLSTLLRPHSRLRLEHFPFYAPELNPNEGVWSGAKRALAYSCPMMWRSWSRASCARSTVSVPPPGSCTAAYLPSEPPSFLLASLFMHAINSVDVVESSVLDGVHT
jgi:hypothetical protein